MTEQENKENSSALGRYQAKLARKNYCLSPNDPIFPIIVLHELFLEDCHGLIDRTGDALSENVVSAFNKLKDSEVLTEAVKTAIKIDETKVLVDDIKKSLSRTKKTIFFMLLATWFVAMPAILVMFLILAQ